MATNYDTYFVNQYKDNIQLLMQQNGSKLEPYVRVEDQTGQYAFYEQMQQITTSGLTAVSSRNAATSYSDLTLNRRRVGLEFFPYSTMIDKPDQVRMLVNPTSTAAQNIAKLFGRKKDAVILAAAQATAYTGQNGGTSTTFDANMIITASGGTWSGSTVGLNIDKLRGAKYLLDANDVDMEGRVFVCHPKQISDLLNTTQITSADYNSVRALVQGEVNTFMGFTFVTTTLLETSGSDYLCYAWHPSAMLLAVGMDDLGFQARIEENQDYNYATQIWNAMMVGATRMDENSIVQVKCQ